MLSSDLFSLYSQAVMNKIVDLEGVTVERVNINNIRYADDTVLIADTEKLQRLVDRLNVECRRVGLKIDIGKTEVMGVTRRKEPLRVNVNVSRQVLKQVRSFRYLGNLVSEDGRCNAEKGSRIGIGKANFGKMREILTNTSLSIEMWLKILKLHLISDAIRLWNLEY